MNVASQAHQSTSVDQAFAKQFGEEVHQAYRRMGSKLRNTVRAKNGVQGTACSFNKVRSGYLPKPTPIECVLEDYYAGDWVDHLDELKINIDERQVLANAGAFALGRKTDELIIAALSGTTNVAGTGADGLTKAKVLEAFELLGDNDVPDDGQRYAVIGWKQWSELLDIDEFANADYVGPDELPWRGTQAKHWLGTMWLPHSGLELAGGVRRCFWYHRSAIGHAVGQDVITDVTWHGDRAAHFVSNSMSQGSCLIDAEGVVELPALEA